MIILSAIRIKKIAQAFAGAFKCSALPLAVVIGVKSQAIIVNVIIHSSKDNANDETKYFLYLKNFLR